MNITDVDDKIIKNAEGDINAYARKWEKSFFEDLQTLNVEIPDQITRVTEFMEEIVEYIAKLIENGVAYEVEGSVYFDVEQHRANGNVRQFSKLLSNTRNWSQELLAVRCRTLMSTTLQ